MSGLQLERKDGSLLADGGLSLEIYATGPMRKLEIFNCKATAEEPTKGVHALDIADVAILESKWWSSCIAAGKRDHSDVSLTAQVQPVRGKHQGCRCSTNATNSICSLFQVRFQISRWKTNSGGSFSCFIVILGVLPIEKTFETSVFPYYIIHENPGPIPIVTHLASAVQCRSARLMQGFETGGSG
jgi:hypothetical protein